MLDDKNKAFLSSWDLTLYFHVNSGGGVGHPHPEIRRWPGLNDFFPRGSSGLSLV